MTLPEIFVRLPGSIADLLVELLERTQLAGDPTKEAVFSAAEDIVFTIKLEFPHEDQPVYELLDLVPYAVVEQLF